MGLSSSQARLLTLTARRSDLEYRAQMISQRKINLALQTEQLAQEFTDKMTNKILKFTYQTGQDNQSETVDLSYDSIINNTDLSAGNFIVKTASGKVVYTDDKNKDAVLNKIYDAEGDVNGWNENEQTVQIPALKDTKYFQDSLRNGSLVLYKLKDNKYEGIDKFMQLGAISEEYDTSDDAAAQALYESKTTALANQDKQLDLELNQINTQHTAIETEVDSIKKVIDNNIKRTYKIFA